MLSPKVIAFTAALVAVVTWWLWGGGVFAWRDMVILDHPTLAVSTDLPARNAPQDWLLGLTGTVLPATWVARLLILAGAVLGAVGAIRLAGSPLAQCTAVTLTLLNPFVIERLLQGHWSLVIAAWLSPAVWAFRHSTPAVLLLLLLGSLSPSGALLLGVVALVSRPRWTVAAGWALLCLPWVVPSLGTVVTSAPTLAFHGRAEALTGTLGSFLSLGGIWNAAATVPSREWGLGLVGLGITLTVALLMPRRLLVLAGTAVAVFLLSGTGLGLALQEAVPAAGLLRDSQKLALLLIPGVVAGAAAVTRPLLQGILLCAALVSIYDGPAALHALRPVAPDPTWQQLPGTMLNLDSRGLEEWQGRIIVDPWSKATATVGAGELVIDGQVIDAVSPRYAAGEEAWRAGDLATLRRLGIDHIRENNATFSLGTATEASQSPLLWLLLPGAALGAVCAIRLLKSRPV